MKRIFVILCAVLIIGIMITGCSMPGVSSNKKESNKNIFISNSTPNKIRGGYPSGNPYFSQDALKYGNSSDLIALYTDWKSKYMTTSGCGSNQIRVQRDEANNYDTVSEGIGYGMLLSVYFNDQAIFDKLYNYCKAHFIKDSNGNTMPLMHWKMDKNGNNVSEFADYVIDGSYVFNNVAINSNSAKIPHDIAYGNLKNGKVFITTVGSQWDSLRTALNNDSNFYKMCQNSRGYSSATDADEDIATALCFASKTFTGYSSINYSQEATNMINAMQQYDFTSDGFIKGGNTWGSRQGWNPSYVTPAYYKFIYAVHCPNSAAFWNNVYTTMYNEMTWVRDSILKINGNNTSLVYYPDWCNTASIKLIKRFQQATAITDRLYYNNGKSTDSKPSPSLGTYVNDARWATYKSGDPACDKNNFNAQFLSFNFYYDAVRVPWRIGTDYSWGGPSASDIYQTLNNSFKNYDNNQNQGRFVTGEPWKFEYRDGFNRNTGGGTSGNLTFRSMDICSQLMDGADNRYWTGVKPGNSPPQSTFNAYCYFGEVLRLISLLYVSGKFQNLYDSKNSYPSTPIYFMRYYNASNGHHYYTIDSSDVGSRYTIENYAFSVYKTSVIDGKSVPLYRAYKSYNNSYLYTWSWDELTNAVNNLGYVYQGIACNVFNIQYNGTIPVYRFSNSSADFIYTTDSSNISGYSKDGIAFFALKAL